MSVILRERGTKLEEDYVYVSFLNVYLNTALASNSPFPAQPLALRLET